MKETTVNLWDEGIHVILNTLTVRGTEKNIQRIEREKERVRFIAPRGGCAWVMTASEFIRRFMRHDD